MFISKSAALALSTYVIALTSAVPLKREVPQEHSHEQFLTTVRTSLNLNNPDQIQDPVFGLLGNAAAAAGAGKITDLDCLQQATADQAFTNAKAAGDANGQIASLVYRSLERNTGKVGLASVLCTSLKAVNPEVAELQQHQDAASSGAAATNKAVEIELAKQIAALGGDPLIALKSATFAPGNVNDATGKGNTCDDANDPVGCGISQNLIVPAATEADITAAVGGAGGAAAGANNGAGKGSGGATAVGSGDGAAESCPAAITVTVGGGSAETSVPAATETAPAATESAPAATETVPAATETSSAVTETAPATTAKGTAAAPPAATSPAASGGNASGSGSSASGGNLQKFTGALGGVTAPAVTAGGSKGFTVENNSDFQNLSAALNRSCDVQKNQCANAANASKTAGFSVNDCDTQRTQCGAGISS